MTLFLFCLFVVAVGGAAVVCGCDGDSWRLVLGGGKRRGDEGRGECGGNEAKVRGRVFLMRMVFCCVRPLEGCWGLSGAGCELTSIAA